MSERPLGNPAIIGLAGFGGTTLLLQFHNLGWMGVGPVFWVGIFFGGIAQLIAGLMEFRTGNSYGMLAFSTYGAFWLVLAGIFYSLDKGFLAVTSHDIGMLMVMYTIFTFVMLLGAMRQNGMLALVFLTLLVGFIFLDIHFLAGSKIAQTIAAIDLIICAMSAWYIMAHIFFGQLKVELPVGRPWLK